MVECARHVNVVKVPTDTVESEALIGRLLSECDYKQQTLLKQLIGILEGDKLARLACVSVSEWLYIQIYCMIDTFFIVREFMSLSREG